MSSLPSLLILDFGAKTTAIGSFEVLHYEM